MDIQRVVSIARSSDYILTHDVIHQPIIWGSRCMTIGVTPWCVDSKVVLHRLMLIAIWKITRASRYSLPDFTNEGAICIKVRESMIHITVVDKSLLDIVLLVERTC
jgi:hypothetical protein